MIILPLFYFSWTLHICTHVLACYTLLSYFIFTNSSDICYKCITNVSQFILFYYKCTLKEF